MEGQAEDNDEVLVLVQFTGVGIDEVIHSDPAPPFKIIGLQENDPVIQIGPQFYSGKVENAPGTNMFFNIAPFDHEKDHRELDKDLQGNLKIWAEHVGTSCKVLNVKRVYPKENMDDVISSADKNTSEVPADINILGE